MKQLTPEQIKTLEDAFASYPEDFKTTSPYASMKGIQKQLDVFEQFGLDDGIICYISKVDMSDKNHPHFTLEKMIIGDYHSKAIIESLGGTEPTESQIRNRMESTGESYYTAREELREQAYGGTHQKPPGQSWGDYWKSY
jgi:hypothetical protein